MSRRIASVTSYLSENEAKNLQNGDIHLAQIVGISREPFGALRLLMAHFFLAFFKLFHLSVTFFDRNFPLKPYRPEGNHLLQQSNNSAISLT